MGGGQGHGSHRLFPQFNVYFVFWVSRGRSGPFSLPYDIWPLKAQYMSSSVPPGYKCPQVFIGLYFLNQISQWTIVFFFKTYEMSNMSSQFTFKHLKVHRTQLICHIAFQLQVNKGNWVWFNRYLFHWPTAQAKNKGIWFKVGGGTTQHILHYNFQYISTNTITRKLQHWIVKSVYAKYISIFKSFSILNEFMDNHENIFVISFWQSIISIYICVTTLESQLCTGRDNSSFVVFDGLYYINTSFLTSSVS